MCRLYGFHANEPTKVECSLVHAQNALLLQSRRDSLGREHADGWGLVSYGEDGMHVEHRASAAYEGVHFGEAAERIYATSVLAHVRRATVGGPSLANTHPFRCGAWSFAHNGTVTAFSRVEGEIARQTSSRFQMLRRGTTDSEQVFLWILSQMEAAGIDPDREGEFADARRLADLVGDAVLLLDRWCRGASAEAPPKLNFVLTNGRVLVATRFNNTLYLLERDGVHDCEICGIPHVHHDSGRRYRAVVVASEPITHETWQEVPNGSVLGVDPALDVHRRELAKETATHE